MSVLVVSKGRYACRSSFCRASFANTNLMLPVTWGENRAIFIMQIMHVMQQPVMAASQTFVVLVAAKTAHEYTPPR
jgi:hypothetical protein